MKRRFFMLIRRSFFLFICLTAGILSADEGMFPISEIHKLNLKEKGLEMDPLEIYNPLAVSLIDGICNIGGCTGSFVSNRGLILTNHHCAYRAIQGASSAEEDFLKNGFLAKSLEQEAPAKGYTVRITESYTDVSVEVLGAVSEGMSFAERTRAIEQRMKEIVARAEQARPGIRASVSEMFTGKTYVLFIYTYLRDVRLVYAPPLAIGNFGGEEDNWIWPRHTGDFSFMRAYVAPDGSPADYDPANVPYQPRRVIPAAPRGANKGDFVFLLGYPGRTFRHNTSHFIAYEEEVRMPWVADWYHWQISVMEKLGEKNRAVELKLSPRIKGLSNTMKNYRGKILGLGRIRLVEKKREEEARLQSFIDSRPDLKEQYGTLLGEIGAVYDEMRRTAGSGRVMDYLLRSSVLLSNAYTLYEASIERQKQDIERESAYMDRNFDRTKLSLTMALGDFYEPADRIIFGEMLKRAAALEGESAIEPLRRFTGNGDPDEAIRSFLERAYSKTALHEPALDRLLDIPREDLMKLDDPFLKLAMDLYPLYQKRKEISRAREGALSELYGRLIDVKKAFLSSEFIPDANGTLRLTCGTVRGYSPKDGVEYEPVTTVNGILEKTTAQEPFDTPAALSDLIRSGDFGSYAHPGLKTIPVAILYDMDTTGGNSGSPVLNARGELVGVNFDRAYEATINDFAWNTAYSRSIAVDIRYILWITSQLGQAGHLLEEMGL